MVAVPFEEGFFFFEDLVNEVVVLAGEEGDVAVALAVVTRVFRDISSEVFWVAVLAFEGVV